MHAEQDHDRSGGTPARLLARIGLEAPPPPTAEGLRVAHRAFCERVPYENLAIVLGRHAALDEDALIERVLAGGRGGYCFEVNTVLLALLRGLGFAITRHEGVVDGPRATNHLVLVADLGADGRFLCDAGLGEGPLDPLRLVPGPATQGPWTWRLEHDGAWTLHQHEHGSLRTMRWTAPPVGLEAFAPHHERLGTHPDSPFVRTLVVQRPGRDRITTLRSRTLTVRGPSVDTRRVLPDAAALAAVLREAFGIDPDALDLDRLWTAACAQHDAFAQAQAAVDCEA